MAENDWFNKDFYQILGVSKTSTDSEITKAYRKLARKYHPDLNKTAEAEQKFKDISEAYDVLSNKESRQKYDAIRAYGAQGFAGGQSGMNFDPNMFASMFGGGTPYGGMRGGRTSYTNINMDDIADMFSAFGGGASSQYQQRSYRQQQPEPERGQNREAHIQLTFKQAVRGTTVSLSVGSEKKFKANIPAGVRDGQKIRLAGKGKSGLHGGAAGDLILHVTVKNDSKFTMENLDLVRIVPISVTEAMLGADVTVSDFDGNPVSLHIPAGSSSGKRITIPNGGVTTKKATGNFIVELRIVVPTQMSPEAEDLTQKLAVILQNEQEDLAQERV